MAAKKPRSAKQVAALKKAQAASAAARKRRGTTSAAKKPASPLAAAQKALNAHYATSASSDPKGWSAKAAKLESEVAKLKGKSVRPGSGNSMHQQAIKQGYYAW